MIYFSDAPVRLDSVDEAQYQLLREFRAKYQTLGIIESFESTSEFREKFSRQLAQLVIARFAPGSKTEAIAFALQERQRSQDPIAASLSPKARELLIASTDGDGVVMRLHTMEGLGIQANDRQFTERGIPRSEVEWDGALQELRDSLLVADMSDKGEVFRATQKGYEVAELIRAGAGSVLPNQPHSDIWAKLEKRFGAISNKGLKAIYNKTYSVPWILSGTDDNLQAEFKGISEMAANQLAQHPTTATQMSLEAIASSSMNRWLNFLWQEGAFKKDAGDVVYPSDELPSTGVIENPCEASSRLCLRLQLPPVAQYSARDWLEMSKDITTVNEDMAWVMWTKRPKATGIRRWDIIGEQAQKLRILLERAGQMLKKSSISNDLSIRLLLEIDPLKRWCEYVSGGGDLRIDGEGYDPDPDSESRIEYSSGRLLNAVKKSEEMCSAIVVKLT